MKEEYVVIDENEKIVESRKPLTFKEVIKSHGGNEQKATEALVNTIVASTNAMKILSGVAKTFKGPQKDNEALSVDPNSGQEVSKGAFKEAFKKFLGL